MSRRRFLVPELTFPSSICFSCVISLSQGVFLYNEVYLTGYWVLWWGALSKMSSLYQWLCLLTLTKYWELSLLKTPKLQHPTPAAIKPYTNTRHQSLYRVFIKEKSGISISGSSSWWGAISNTLEGDLEESKATGQKKNRRMKEGEENRGPRMWGSHWIRGRWKFWDKMKGELKYIHCRSNKEHLGKSRRMLQRRKRADGEWLMFRSLNLCLFDLLAHHCP